MDDWILSSCDKACVSSDLPTSELNVDLLERHTTGPLTMASDPAPEANLPPRMTRRSVVKVRFGDNVTKSAVEHEQVTDFENIYMDDWILSSCDKACVSSDLPTSELNVDLLERHTTGPLTMASDPAPEANLPPRMTRRSVVKVRFGDNVTKSAVEHEQANAVPLSAISPLRACSSTVLEPREAFRERGCGGPIGPRPEPLWVSTHRGETRDVDVVLEWIYNAVAVWPQATSLETSGQVLVGFVVGVLLCHGVLEMSDFSASVSCDCFMGLSSSERVFAFSLFFISVVAALLKVPHRQDSCVVLCVGRQDTFRG
jgi:hypothetical protein